MTREQNIIRGLVIYGTVLPLAVILGYLLSNPLHRTTMTAVLLVVLVLITPLILRFHHPLLILAWNMTAVVPVLPGNPQLWLVMTLVSFTVSLVQYAINRRVRFWHTTSVLVPLLFIGAVVFGTAMMTGGMGMRITGGETIGGKRYFLMFFAILGYIAMTARPIPKNRVGLYSGLFILGAVTNVFSSLLPYVPPALYPMFMIFPAEVQGIASVLGQNSFVQQQSIARPYGLSVALMSVAFFLLARQGLDKLLRLRNPALYICIGAFVFSTLGGFRAFLFLLLVVFTLVFFFEGGHKTKKMPAVVIVGVLTCALAVAFVERLPESMQRSLSFLPIHVDPVVEANAKASSEWRFQMWRELVREIPNYFFLGKGLSITAADIEAADNLARQGRGNTAEVAMLAGDYHSGPLSVIIPFGIWGTIGWFWFCIAGMRAMYLNYRWSEPELKTTNTLLFAYFMAKMVMFHFVFGGFYFDLAFFAGIVGFSISLNHGIRMPVLESTPQVALHGPLARPRLVPSFSGSLRRI